ncbi:restriction endonuclease subunit S [Aggregatibacter aphrophilus]|jgi:type I restriction enzyme ecoKI specificity protein|uniref:Type I restriction modification DNA specificity domain-containing protein n=1 Tax=Aggregatibacter aphrophilus TaxID=732 RepID=A0ABX9VVV9_AGGAP|nr:restriction endonuclease subunit S [Aggregatibacter aphrophilus]RMW89117.1 hypothetical protein DOL88_03400 [Aggregatibacter aphrophilus]
MKEDVLPEGWELKKLGSVVQYEKGKKPSNLNDEKNDIFTIPYIDIQGFEKGIIKSWTDGKNARLCQNSDLLMVWDGARAGLVGSGSAGALGSTLMKISFPKVNHTYGFYFLYSKFSDINSNTKGTGIPHVDPSVLWNFEFPIPPLPEQQYLSQKLTALLDEVAQTKQRLEAIPALLKQFRQSVLADAVSGRLTEEWRENKEYELIDKLTFPKGWMKSTLGKEFNYGSCKKKSPDEILNQEWVLELEDIEKDNSNILNKITNATRQAKSTKNVFKKGDVLYGKLRPYLNKIVIADGDGVCTTEIIPISSNERICNQYLFYWLKSPYFFNYVNEITYGVNMPRLGTQDGKKAIIVFPSKEEQTQIVQKVETYFALADEIETQVKAALENVNLLTQSILAKAFSGELSAAWRKENRQPI